MSCIYVNIVNNQCKYDFVYKFPLMLQKERHRVIKPFKPFKQNGSNDSSTVNHQ